MLVRQVYASRLGPGTGEPEIDDILEWSVGWNGEHGVTGVIAFDDGKVMQILEGPMHTIDALFSRIRVDSRHQGVVSLRYDEIAERHFSGWHLVRRSMSDLLMLVESLGD